MQGRIRSVESLSLSILRLAEEHAMKENTGQVLVQAPSEIANYLLNEKRRAIVEIEQRHDSPILIVADEQLETPHYNVSRIREGDLGEETGKPSYHRTTPRKLEIHSLTRAQINVPTLPAVTNVKPTQPAPIRETREEEPVSPAAPAPVAMAPAPAKPGLFSRLKTALFGAPAVEPAAPARPEREERGRNEPRRDRGRDHRGQQHGNRGPQAQGNRQNPQGRPQQQQGKQQGKPQQQAQQPKPERSEEQVRQDEQRKLEQQQRREEQQRKEAERREAQRQENIRREAERRAAREAERQQQAAATPAATEIAGAEANPTEATDEVVIAAGDVPLATATAEAATGEGGRRRRGRRGGRRRRRQQGEAGEAGAAPGAAAGLADFDEEEPDDEMDGEEGDRSDGSPMAEQRAHATPVLTSALPVSSYESDFDDLGEPPSASVARNEEPLPVATSAGFAAAVQEPVAAAPETAGMVEVVEEAPVQAIATPAIAAPVEAVSEVAYFADEPEPFQPLDEPSVIISTPIVVENTAIPAFEAAPAQAAQASLDLPLPVESAPTPEAPAPEAPTSYGALTPSAANVEPSETQPSVEAPRPPIV